MLEDAAYRRLIDWYYQAEAPIPADERAIFRRVRASNEDEREAVRAVLGEFFQLEDGVYRHRRCDAEIARVQEKSEKARKSVAQRRDRQSLNDKREHGSTNVEQESTNVAKSDTNDLLPIANSQEPIAKTQREKKERPPAAAARPEEVPEQVWEDWHRVRAAKKAGPVTPTALAGIGREAAQAGLPLAEAIAVCCERSWVGFRADWYANLAPQARASPARGNDRSAKAAASNAEALRLLRGEPADDPNTIDMEAA